MACRLANIIKEYKNSDPLSRGEFINKLVESYKEKGFAPEDIKTISDMVNKQFDISFRKDSERYLKSLLKQKEGTKNFTLDKILKLINSGAYDNNSIRDVLKEKYGLPILSQNEAKHIITEMDRISKLLHDSKDYHIGIAKIRQLIEDKNPSNWFTKQKAIKDLALLGNPTTQAVNILGNIGQGSLDIASQHLFGIALDKLASLRTGNKTIGISSRKLLSGAKEGAIDAVIDATGGLRLKDLQGLSLKEKVSKIIEGIQNPISRPIFEQTQNKFEMSNHGIVFKGQNSLQNSDKAIIRGTGNFLAKTGKVGRVIMNLLYSSLGGPDRVFKQAYYDDTLNMLIKSNKISEATPEMRQLAEQVASERTFTDVNFLSNIGKIILSSPNKITNSPQVANLLRFTINSVFPYLTTPMNLAKRTLEFSPLGLMEGIARFGKIIAKPEGVTIAEQRYAVDRVSRGLAGTMLLYAGIKVKEAGIATPKEDLSNMDKKTFMDEVTIQPNSLKIGDTTIDLTRLQPTTSSFIAGVNLQENLNKKDKSGTVMDIADNLTSAMSNALEFYTDNVFLQQVKTILGGGQQKSIAENISDFAIGVPNQYFPNILKKTASVSDNFQRETYDQSATQQKLINTFQKQTPGIRENLPQKYSTLGQPLKEYNGDNGFWNVFFNPIKIGKADPTPVQSELLRLNEKTNSNSVFPNIADKFIEWNGQKKMLTGSEKQQYQKIMGENTNKVINTLIQQYDYKKSSDENKAKAVQQSISNAKAEAIKSMAQELGLEPKNKKVASKPLGIRIPKKPLPKPK